jgi:hypothetical protein
VQKELDKAFNLVRPAHAEDQCGLRHLGQADVRRGMEQASRHPALRNNPTDEPDPAPFKVHLLTRAGRLMRARSEPVRALATKDEAIRFAGRQLGEHYAVYHKDRKIWPAS